MNPIKKALLGVTFFELFGAFGWFLTGWALPKGTDFVFASGSMTSCNFQGLLFQLFLGAPMFNTLLQYLFYILVNGNHSPDQIVKIEKVSYTLIVAFTLVVSIVPLSLKQINPFSQLCWINGFPSGCSESVFGGSDVPCERGLNAHWIGIIFFYVIIWSSMIIIIILNVMTLQTLLKKDSDTNSSQFVARQGRMYTAAYLITWTPSTIMVIMTYAGRGGFSYDILPAICEPLQGFWNMLIILQSNPSSVERLKSLLRCNSCKPSGEVESAVVDETVPTEHAPKQEKNKTIEMIHEK
jgi:hypothetical protein